MRAAKENREGGQAIVEFLFASLLAIVMILGVIQIALLFNAQSMVKLAAFRAARGAIVDKGNPALGKKANLYTMKAYAKFVAWLTILPVIPAMHAKMPTDAASLLEAFNDPDIGKNFRRAVYELFGRAYSDDIDSPIVDVLDVDILEADSARLWAQHPALDRWNTLITPKLKMDRDMGDLPGRVSFRVIRVKVTWQYPLVVPIVNRIFIAIAKPGLWRAALGSGGISDPQSTQQIIEARDDAQKMPIWATGTSLDAVFAKPENIFFHVLERIPVSATFVMRMQEDAGPNYIEMIKVKGLIPLAEEGPQLEEQWQQVGVDLGGDEPDPEELTAMPLETLNWMEEALMNAGQDAVLDMIGAPHDPSEVVP